MDRFINYSKPNPCMSIEVRLVKINMYSFYTMYKKAPSQEKVKAEGHCGEPFEWSGFIQQLISFYSVFGVIFYASVFGGPIPIIKTEPLIPALLFTFIFAHNTMCIQVAHVSRQKYNPWSSILLLNLIVFAVYDILLQL